MSSGPIETKDEKKLNLRRSKIFTQEKQKVLSDVLFNVLQEMPKELCLIISSYVVIPIPYFLYPIVEQLPYMRCLQRHTSLGLLLFTNKGRFSRSIYIYSEKRNWALIYKLVGTGLDGLAVWRDRLLILDGVLRGVTQISMHNSPVHLEKQEIWRHEGPINPNPIHAELRTIAVNGDRCFISDYSTIFCFYLTELNDRCHLKLQTNIMMNAYITLVPDPLSGHTFVRSDDGLLRMIDSENKIQIVRKDLHNYYTIVNGLHCVVYSNSKSIEFFNYDNNEGVLLRKFKLKNPFQGHILVHICGIDNLIFLSYSSFIYVIHQDLLFDGSVTL